MAFVAPIKSSFSHAFSRSGKTRYTLTLQPDGVDGLDTWVDSTNPTTNNGSSALFSIMSGMNGLLKFDLSGIPPGATIISATMSLFLGGNRRNATNSAYAILIANTSWTEMGATYNTRDGSNAWAGGASGCGTSGVDHRSTALGSFGSTGGDTPNPGKEYVMSYNLTEFAYMLANNSGIVIKNTASASLGLATSDYPVAVNRPKLVVVYDI